jgi:predicted ATPase
LEPLNLLIGPNGSGKSNLIELIDLLRTTPSDRALGPRKGGALTDWIWKGARNAAGGFDCVVANRRNKPLLRHKLLFRAPPDATEAVIHDEEIENAAPMAGHERPYFYYHFQHGEPRVNLPGSDGGTRKLAKESVDARASIVSQRKDPENYPEITHLNEVYRDIRIYREWAFGRETVFRLPQKADMRSDRLEEDFSNLGLFLNHLKTTPKAKRTVLEGLRDLSPGIEDFDVSVKGGSVQVYLTEGDFSIPATRMSDGTLRYLALLAILCDPEPPKLICIEEPELGLHPDLLPKLADKLVEASSRTQLIVTTHSDTLVDAMTERPTAVVVCEKHEGRTRMQRLRAEEITPFLTNYRLGQLWTSGQIGGSRW